MRGGIISNSKASEPFKNGDKKYFYDSTREEYVPENIFETENDNLEPKKTENPTESPRKTKEIAVQGNELKNSIVQTDTAQEELEILKTLSLTELSPRGSVYDDPNTLYLIRTADNKYLLDKSRNIYVTKHRDKTLTIVSNNVSKKSRILLGNGKVSYDKTNSNKKNQQPVLLGFIPVNGLKPGNSLDQPNRPFNPYENDPYYTTFVDGDHCHKCKKKIETVQDKKVKFQII